MKKFLLLVLILLFFVSGCIVRNEIKSKRKLDCISESVVSNFKRESHIVLYFNKNEELIKYDHSSKTFYNYNTYNSYKNMDEESKRDFIFNDSEKSITYKQMGSAPFNWHDTEYKDIANNYDELKNYYMNHNYTCNKEISKQVSIKDIYTFSKPIIRNDKLYFNDYYNNNYLTMSDLEGRNKEVLFETSDAIKYIQGDYIYLDANKKYSFTTKTVSEVNDYLNVADFYDNNLNYLSVIKNINSELEVPVVYKNNLITSTKSTIKLANEVVYLGTRINFLGLIGDFVFIEENDEIVKFDLVSRKIVAKYPKTSKIDNFASDAGIVYVIDEQAYRITGETEPIHIGNASDYDELFYSANHLVYSKVVDDELSLTVDTTVYENIKSFQIDNNKIYIVLEDATIKVIE